MSSFRPMTGTVSAASATVWDVRPKRPSKTWGAASTYHLCINSSVFGDEGTADFILDFASRKLSMKF